MAAEINFEKSMTELEDITKTLEDGSIALEDALKLFEKGVKLASQCTKTLDKAEQKVKVLLKDADGALAENDFLNAEQ